MPKKSLAMALTTIRMATLMTFMAGTLALTMAISYLVLAVFQVIVMGPMLLALLLG
jgi:hypothetical protein